MKNVKYFLVLLICQAATLSSAVSVRSERKSPKFTETTAVDLGVDVSDDYVSSALRQALVNATLSVDTSLNQYTESHGHKRFLNAVATLYSHVTGNTLNPRENVIATIGATEALVIAFQGLTKPGDEWIIIEPFWSKFKVIIELAHGIPRYTNLKLRKTSGHIIGSDWELDREEFASLFNNRTRGILLNNPNNPSGKLYTRSELEFIADLVEKWNVTVISDEAHEWVVFGSRQMVRFGTLPGMFNRTLTVGSASKTFNVAGWRIGWIYGPTHLMNRLIDVHHYFVQSAPTPQQIAVAYAIEQEFKDYGKPFSYFKTNALNTMKKRDLLVQGLRKAGMFPIIPDGGHCMMATWPNLGKQLVSINQEPGNGISEKFSNWMIKYIGVLGFPVSEYYGDERRQYGEKYIRLCYHKKNETIQLAADYLMRFRYFY